MGTTAHIHRRTHSFEDSKMSLFSTFKTGKNYIKRKDKRKSPRADNFVFRLHYQFTFGILWVAMMLVAGQNYIDSSGSAIQCMQDKGNGVPGKIMNNYCWIMSTYTLPRLWDGETNIDFIHPGVGPVEDGEEKVYHNFVNIIVQIKITDVFLGGAFSNFGLAAASWSSQDEEFRTDPLIRIFPRMTKCHFGLYGGSGALQKFDALCVLGMNIINEKVYVVLWFWFMLLAVITGLSIVFRIVPVFVPSVRKWGAYNMRANNLDDVDVDEEKVSNDSTLPLKTKF